MKRRSVFLATMFLGALPMASAAQQPGQLEGRITETRSGDPVPGVNILLTGGDLNRGTTTTEDGRYLLQDVPAGTYRLEASILGYEKHISSVEVRAGQTKVLDLVLNETSYGLEEAPPAWRRSCRPYPVP